MVQLNDEAFVARESPRPAGENAGLRNDAIQRDSLPLPSETNQFPEFSEI
jgi:hypothetical protein